MTVAEAKAELRRTIRMRLQSLTAAQRAVGASQICQRVLAQDFWKSAKTVLLFAPLPDEVDIWPLMGTALAEGKIIALPRLDKQKNHYVIAQVSHLERNLVAGAFGIQEPSTTCAEIPLEMIDVALVPGLAFDDNSRRLGRGKGFYDRLLSNFRGIKCGVTMEELILDDLPVDLHDVRMDTLVTPNRIIRQKL
jgi:5-formyltetrahydrofolate cyclo-ligase